MYNSKLIDLLILNYLKLAPEIIHQFTFYKDTFFIIKNVTVTAILKILELMKFNNGNQNECILIMTIIKSMYSFNSNVIILFFYIVRYKNM